MLKNLVRLLSAAGLAISLSVLSPVGHAASKTQEEVLKNGKPVRVVKTGTVRKVSSRSFRKPESRFQKASRTLKAQRSASLRKVGRMPLRHDADGDGNLLSVQSAAALVVDQASGEVLYQKNADAVVPIASITKLMTAMVVLDAALDLKETITISAEDIDTLKGSHSRLPVGARVTREHALLLALMSSENRAAHALGRTYPGGLAAFVEAMNFKAASLEMLNSHFRDPTGLSSDNVSTARDLSKMVAAAHGYPVIRELSTTASAHVDVGRYPLGYQNTNALVRSSNWEIGLSKTGYIQEAGKCLVMQAWVAGKPTVMVLLDSNGKLTRIADANRVRKWLEKSPSFASRASPNA